MTTNNTNEDIPYETRFNLALQVLVVSSSKQCSEFLIHLFDYSIIRE